MIIAADYPFLDIVWTMLVFFLWVCWIWMMVFLLSDLFGRTDIGGWGKAAWCVLMIFLPFVGVLAYLISQHDKIAERRLAEAERARRAFGGGAATEIARAAELRDKGVISAPEFEALKAKALAA